jgi:hypothetical protein
LHQLVSGTDLALATRRLRAALDEAKAESGGLSAHLAHAREELARIRLLETHYKLTERLLPSVAQHAPNQSAGDATHGAFGICIRRPTRVHAATAAWARLSDGVCAWPPSAYRHTREERGNHL